MKILVPIDFTSFSENAALAALSLAQKTKGEVHLLTAISVPLDWAFTTMGAGVGSGIPSDLFLTETPNFDENKVKVNEQLTTFANSLPKNDVTIKTETTIGFPWEQITQYADNHKVDLIVMGTHGASGLNELFVGSNAEKIVRYAECPVLTLHGEENNINFKNMVFASSFFGETAKSFPQIVKLANIFDSHIHLLKVITNSSFETTRYSTKVIEDFIAPFNLTNYSIHTCNETSVEKGVLNFAEDTDADLIAIETHGRKGLIHMFIGSIAEDITNHAKRPVLTVKIEEVPINYGVIFPGN
ncbi:MAG: nucleotide-binding universal stress UspA family protein [Flavobacteriales bacterium]|jgi:nucleotide-binding universal stress UspA family protein